MHGIVLVNKPLGITSNQAIQRIKKTLHAAGKKVKIGHTGTLDPQASGMLVVCLGEATKICGFLLEADKHYTTTMRLGVTTDSGDASGVVLERTPIPKLNQIIVEKALRQFEGSIEQIPPMVSALKHAGKPLYQYAIEGKHIQRKARQISIHAIRLLGFFEDTISIDVHCSKGTYIRTLAEDIAIQLGTGGHVIKLHRDWSAPFTNNEMITMEQLDTTESIEKALLPIEAGLPNTPQIQLDEVQTKHVKHGRTVETHHCDCNLVIAHESNGALIGLGQIKQTIFHPIRLFNIK